MATPKSCRDQVLHNCLYREKVSQVCRIVGLLSLSLLEEALMESRSELKGGKRPWISLGTQRGLKALVPILLFLFPFSFFFFIFSLWYYLMVRGKKSGNITA